MILKCNYFLFDILVIWIANLPISFLITFFYFNLYIFTDKTINGEVKCMGMFHRTQFHLKSREFGRKHSQRQWPYPGLNSFNALLSMTLNAFVCLIFAKE